MTKESKRDIKKQKLVKIIELRVQTGYDISGFVGVNINQFTEDFLNRQISFYKENFPDLSEQYFN